MHRSKLRLTWLVWVAIGALLWVVAGCGVAAPAVPTATSVSTPTLESASQPTDLVILYTCHTEGIVESTAASGG
jgi:hypothetical protein